MATRLRAEPFGAWLWLDEPAGCVAIDRPTARKLGIPSDHPQWGPTGKLGGPLEVHLAVTGRCHLGCDGCYMDALPEGPEPSLAQLERRLQQLAQLGPFSVAFGGGEPLTRSDLPQLAAYARTLGLLPVVTTSGAGMTPALARSLLGFAQVNVSYDGQGQTYVGVRGVRGAKMAEHAMSCLGQAGVAFGANIVLTRESLPQLPHTLEHLAALGACEVQLLRYKPTGRAAASSYHARKLSPAQVRGLPELLRKLSLQGSLGLRIDCSLVPLLAHGIEEPALLTRAGIFGCEAGRHFLAQDPEGLLQGCSFLPPDPELAAPYDGAPDLLASLSEPCASCEYRSVCRGGCQAVARFYQPEDAGPDPECPRVLAYRGERRPSGSHFLPVLPHG